MLRAATRPAELSVNDAIYYCASFSSRLDRAFAPRGAKFLVFFCFSLAALFPRSRLVPPLGSWLSITWICDCITLDQ